MKKIKSIYLLILLVICLLPFATFPTYAKFPSDYITNNDIVGFELNFNIGISNIEEYEEIKINANNHKAFNVEITNTSDNEIYYGIWYKMISPKTKNNDIFIARVNSTEVATTGNIDSNNNQTVSLVIINKTDSPVKIAIGVATSTDGINNIEYLNGKHLITEYASIPINKNAIKYIQELYNDEKNINTINIANDKEKPKIFVNNNNNILLDNNGEYRYYGTDPNNYILFNNELWRIISISNINENNHSSKKIKIIRNNPIGLYSWDSTSNDINNGYGVNDWSKSDIMNLLNTLYYNSKNGNCTIDREEKNEECDFTKNGLNEESRKMIDKETYYLGKIDENNLDKIYANDYYTAERKGEKWEGYVGLMYASDYAYSVNNTASNIPPFKYEYNSNSWLKITSNLINEESTLSAVSNNNSVLSINNIFGNITNKKYNKEESKFTIDYPSNKKIIRPVVYLKENTIIIDGIGTSDNPYTIRQ